jgi:hypothetical protein
VTPQQLRTIWEKTNGHCHFCGDALSFGKRGYRRQRAGGRWEADHVTQRHRGGAVGVENRLPACTRCNRLRWHRAGGEIRQLLRLGIIALSEIEKQTVAGKRLVNKAPRSMLLHEPHRSNRIKLIKFLKRNVTRSFTAAELQKHTSVPKKWTTRLLETSRQVTVIPGGGRYCFQGRRPKKSRQSEG